MITDDVTDHLAAGESKRLKVTSEFALGDIRVRRLEGGGVAATFELFFTGPEPGTRIDGRELCRFVKLLSAIGDIGDGPA